MQIVAPEFDILRVEHSAIDEHWIILERGGDGNP
jgi:hypothetical protein